MFKIEWMNNIEEQMFKYRLMLTTLPWVALIGALAVLRDYVLHIKGVIEFSSVAPVLGAVALIAGFMLAGVLSDYKESEKIPGEIATTLETIGDTVETVRVLNKDSDLSDFRPRFIALVGIIDDWFMHRVSTEKCYAALTDFREVIIRMHSAVSVNYTIRSMSELHNLRRLITRAEVISRTTFVPVGYALLDLLVAATLVLLLAANYSSPLAEYFLITLFSLIYIYMIRLIYDLDNPFMYLPKKFAGGSAEVNPFPLSEYRHRLEPSKKRPARPVTKKRSRRK
jgi:hypothetical protein